MNTLITMHPALATHAAVILVGIFIGTYSPRIWVGPPPTSEDLRLYSVALSVCWLYSLGVVASIAEATNSQVSWLMLPLLVLTNILFGMFGAFIGVAMGYLGRLLIFVLALSR